MTFPVGWEIVYVIVEVLVVVWVLSILLTWLMKSQWFIRRLPSVYHPGVKSGDETGVPPASH
jgi:hypothetical protein